MRQVEELLEEYGESHRNRFNKVMHWVCVPLIMFSLLGLLWPLATPAWFATLPYLNWAVVLVIAAMAYYLAVSPPLAAGVLLVISGMLALLAWLDAQGVTLWMLSLGIFIAAWVGQFVGHHVEGRRPSFFTDIRFLLIGPLWLLAFIYRRLDISY